MRPEQPLPQMRLAGCTQPTGQEERGPRLPQTEPGRCGFGVPLKFMLLQNCETAGVARQSVSVTNAVEQRRTAAPHKPSAVRVQQQCRGMDVRGSF